MIEPRRATTSYDPETDPAHREAIRHTRRPAAPMVQLRQPSPLGPVAVCFALAAVACALLILLCDGVLPWISGVLAGCGQ